MKEFDSERRHIQVRLNKAKVGLEIQRLPFDLPTKVIDTPSPPTGVQPEPTPEPPVQHYSNIVEQLTIVSQERVDKQKELHLIKKFLSDFTIEIEALQDQLVKEEEAFILNQLNKFESEEAKLAIHKLLHRKQCPACGSETEELSAKAQQYAKQERCPLCGTEQKIGGGQQLPLLDAELSEKLRNRTTIEEQLIRLEQKLDILHTEEESLRLKYDERLIERLGENLKTVAMEEETDIEELAEIVDIANPPMPESPEEKVKRLQEDYDRAHMRFIQLQRELEEKYADFSQVSRDRIETLAGLYQEYATAFLGINCELEPHKADIKFLDLELYVPKFENELRPNPESCSEAQRFFLDIAFRMAMIDLCYKLSEAHGTFICETPENALDITYIDNVAEMFKSFSRRGHGFLATSNLQPGALAGPMLADFTLEQKQESILNLLDYGNLSKVQIDHRPDLERELASILAGDRD